MNKLGETHLLFPTFFGPYLLVSSVNSLLSSFCLLVRTFKVRFKYVLFVCDSEREGEMRREYSPLTIIKSLSSTSSFTSSTLSSASAASILSMCSLSCRRIELATYRFPAVERRERRRTRVSPSFIFLRICVQGVCRACGARWTQIGRTAVAYTTSNKLKRRGLGTTDMFKPFKQCPSHFQGLHAYRKFCGTLTKHLGPPWSGLKASHLRLHSGMTTSVLGKSFNYLYSPVRTVDEYVYP